MNYNELKQQYDNARKEQLSVNKEIKRLTLECAEAERSETSIRDKYSSELVTEKKNALEVYRTQRVRPFEEKLNVAKSELDAVKAEYTEKLAENNSDAMLESCSSKKDILDEIKSISESMNEKLVAVLGERFCAVVKGRIESTDVSIQGMDLDRLITYFNRSSMMLEKYASNGSIVDSAFAKFDEKIMEKGENGKGDMIAMVGMSIVMLVLLIIFTKPFSIIFTVILSLMAVFYLMRNYKVYSVAIILKAVEDNVDFIEASLKEQIDAELVRREEELKKVYEPVISRLEKTIDGLNQSILDVSEDAINTFTFDDTKVQQRLQSELAQVEKRKSSLLVQKANCDNDLVEKTARVKELQEKMGNLLNGLQDKFLFGVGKDTIFNPTFLFDVDTAIARPEYFTHPEAPILVLYDDLRDVNDFIRLLSVQLRAKLNPFNLNITVHDFHGIGNEFFCFTDDSLPSSSRMYTIIHNSETERDWINTIVNELMRKQRAISRGFGSIKEYNRYMISIDSLTESYEFVFVLSPELSFFENQDVMRIVTNGASFGIFVHAFVSVDDLIESKQSAMTLLGLVDRAYMLRDGKLFERAKDYVIENVIKPDEK